MRQIKIKLPFTNESVLKRRVELLETAKILANNSIFKIIEEKHFDKMSYLVIVVLDDVKQKKQTVN